MERLCIATLFPCSGHSKTSQCLSLAPGAKKFVQHSDAPPSPEQAQICSTMTEFSISSQRGNHASSLPRLIVIKLYTSPTQSSYLSLLSPLPPPHPTAHPQSAGLFHTFVPRPPFTSQSDSVALCPSAQPRGRNTAPRLAHLCASHERDPKVQVACLFLVQVLK